jgi:hypothetical protein
MVASGHPGLGESPEIRTPRAGQAGGSRSQGGYPGPAAPAQPILIPPGNGPSLKRYEKTDTVT